MAYTYVNSKTGQVLVTNRRVQGGFWEGKAPKEEVLEEEPIEEPEEEPIEEPEEELAEETAPKKTGSRRGKK